MAAELNVSRDFTRPTLKKTHGALLAGAPNPLWDAIQEIIVDTVFRYLLDQDDGPVKIPGLNIDKWDVATVVQWCGNGATQYGQNVTNYVAYVKLPLANLNDPVPLYLTGSRIVNVDGTNGHRKKWSEWKDNVPKTDTHAYIELNGGGVVEDGKTIARLVGDGLNVIQQKQARNQLAAFQGV